MASYTVEAASIINEYLPTQNHELENRLFDALADVADLLREYGVEDIKAPRYRGHNSAAPYFDAVKLAVIDYVGPEIWDEAQAKSGVGDRGPDQGACCRTRMGRVDIAILSNISIRITLCLHPPLFVGRGVGV